MSDDKKTKNMRMPFGLIFGAGIGVVLGLAFGKIALGVSLGAGVGLLLGVLFDRAKRKSDDT
jgi:uncharacterized membrane protein YoaK (UPF0700 family)